MKIKVDSQSDRVMIEGQKFPIGVNHAQALIYEHVLERLDAIEKHITEEGSDERKSKTARKAPRRVPR